MSLFLHGLGTAVPRFSISQADAAEIAIGLAGSSDEKKRVIGALYGRAGVSRRHSNILEADSGPLELRQKFFLRHAAENPCGPTTSERMKRFEVEAGQLAAIAARNALAGAAVSAEELTHLVTVSCSGFHAPGFDVSLVDDLSLPRNIARTHVGFMGCHGALNALRVARSFSQSAPQACTLICCVELCSLHHQYGDNRDQFVANALFSDGAAALVCRSIPREGRQVPQVVDNASTIVPGTKEAMTWRIGDHGFAMSLSAQVPDLIHRELKPWLSDWLGHHQLGLSDIRSWAIHPG